MSFVISKDELKKEGEELLYKLRDSLDEFKDMFRSNSSESFKKVIVLIIFYFKLNRK